MAVEEVAGSDEELVQSTLQGDEQSFAELARRHKTRVFGLVSRFAHGPYDLEDLCQEIFIQAYLKLRQYRRDSPFEHWLLRIATHKCYDYLRRGRRQASHISYESLLDAGHEESAPRLPPPHPHLERLDAALAQLSTKERLVITLLELEDRTVQEVAGLTGWSAANVKVRAFRARSALRKILEQSA